MAASEPDLSTPYRSLQVAGVVLILILLRIPALTGYINLHNDATEYIDIARNIAAGEGPVLKIRSYFFNDGFTLPYPAAPLRSILFPLLMSGVYSLAHSNLVFQWFNLGIFALNMLLMALILHPIVPSWMLPYSLLLIGLCEPMFLTSIFPGSEQTAFLFLLLVILMLSREVHRKWGLWGGVAEGLAASCASMSRPEYLLVFVLAIAWLWYRERRLQLCCAFLAGFFIPLALLYAFNYHHYGRLYITSGYLFRSRHYKSFFTLQNSGGSNNPAAFVLENYRWIAAGVLRNAINYVAKLVGYKNMFLLAAALPLVWMGFRKESWRKRHLALVPAAFFVSYSLVWSTLDRERFLLAMTPFLLPLCLIEINKQRIAARRKWVKVVCILIMGANLPLFLINTIHAGIKIQNRPALGERFYVREDSTWSNPDVPLLTAWIKSNTANDDIFCIDNPFLLNFQTGRPALLLPEYLDPADFLPLLKTYKVRYWIYNPVYANRPASLLTRLRQIAQGEGFRQVARCGSYEIWSVQLNR